MYLAILHVDGSDGEISISIRLIEARKIEREKKVYRGTNNGSTRGQFIIIKWTEASNLASKLDGKYWPLLWILIHREIELVGVVWITVNGRKNSSETFLNGDGWAQLVLEMFDVLCKNRVLHFKKEISRWIFEKNFELILEWIPSRMRWRIFEDFVQSTFIICKNWLSIIINFIRLSRLVFQIW